MKKVLIVAAIAVAALLLAAPFIAPDLAILAFFERPTY